MLKVERRICGHKWDRTRWDQLAHRRQNFAPTAEIWSASIRSTTPDKRNGTSAKEIL